MLFDHSRIKTFLEANNLDALVATTPENVAYLTGFWIVTHLRHRMRQVFAVITKDSPEPALIISRGLADGALTTDAWVKEYHLYGNFFICPHSRALADEEGSHYLATLDEAPAYGSSVEALAGCLKGRGLAAGRIGVDQGTDVINIPGRLTALLPQVQTVPAYDLFRSIRIVKTEEEIRRIRHSASVTEQALMDAIGAIQAGANEYDIARAFSVGVASRGGLPSLDCIGAGLRGAYPSVTARGRVIQPGDTVRFDVGCVAECYHSDMARTAVLGTPSDKVARYSEALIAGEKAIIEAIKPGVVVSDLFQLGVETVRANGLPHYERTHCGHGNGIEGYDLPQINPSDHTVLEAGMVLCVETPYYEPGFAGLQIEDMVAVRENGAERLTTIPQILFRV